KTVINNAENVFFLIAGENKSATLQKVTQGEFLSEIFPMQLIKPKNGEIDLLVEWAAVRWLMVDN
ncbi:MAG: 6-phosphogluconolactonase, partial [Defluviitaleaceae bacterium]|nr:6-phosphogluconolactonase [Defluviitaleaceae bacterium]